MKYIRDSVENWLEKAAAGLVQYRWLVLLFIVIFSLSLGAQVRKLQMDTSTEGFFHKDDPELINYNAFRDQFGRDEMVVIAIKSNSIFTIPFLNKLNSLHRELENKVPHTDDITSLVNARLTIGQEGALLVKDLLEDFPQNQRDLSFLKEKVMNHPFYRNLLISRDGTFTTIVIKSNAYSSEGVAFDENEGFDLGAPGETALNQESAPRKLLTDKENSEIVRAIKSITEKYKDDDFQIYLGGSPVVTEFLKRAMQTNMGRFTGLSILCIGILLFILFRRIPGVLLPLMVVILSVITTLGVAGLLGKSLKLPSMILPSFVIAVGVGYSVHLLAIFFRKYTDKDKKEEAIVYAVSHSGLPIFMTGITTAAGLGSFISAEVASIGDLGLFATNGVILALFYTLILLPPLLAVIPIKPGKHSESHDPSSRLDKILQAAGDMAYQKPWVVIIVSAVLILFSFVGLSKLRLSHNTLKWFPSSSVIRQETEIIDKNLKGSLSVEVIVDTGKENGLYNPKVMTALNRLSDKTKAYLLKNDLHLIDKTISLADLLKEINQALNENRSEFYTIPQDEQLIAQEFLLFENSGSDDLEDMVDSLFSKARFTAKAPWNDATTYVGFVENIKRDAKNLFGDLATVKVTGLMLLFTHTIHAMMNSAVISYSIAAAVITLLMIILIGRFRMGILSMIPNLSPIIITLGLMGWLGIPLDMFTLLIGSIAIGLAVDDTIHFFHNFRKYFEQTNDARFAIRETLHTAGRAMLFTSIVLSFGFWLFMFATLNNIFYFGLLTGISLILAFLADILLAPAMLTLLVKTSIGQLKEKR